MANTVESCEVPSASSGPSPRLVQTAPFYQDMTELAFREYFSQERMLEKMGNTTLHTPDCFVVAYKYSAWHPSPVMEQRFGNGWTEFELVKGWRRIFPEHIGAKRPLWGFFNEADPDWVSREIDTAVRYGINAWMINWYWHDGIMFYHEQLENGFLKAPNRDKIKFAIMWANHDWKDVFPAKSPEDASMILPQRYSEADLLRLFDYCIRNYFVEPNYWRINGGLVFGILDLATLVESLGLETVKRTFATMRQRVRHAGLGELHLQSNHVHGNPAHLKELGIDSTTSYHLFAWTYCKETGGITPYGAAASESIESWQRSRAVMPVPFLPDCAVGWDDSPRFGARSQIVSNRSPDQFERLCRAARSFSYNNKERIVFLSAWNEWTEDHVLLPDWLFGYSYLEAVRRAFRE